MNKSTGIDKYIAKRVQADKPLVPSVNYGVDFQRFRSLYGLEIVGSEIILCPSKKPTYDERNF